jgi:hypothetical protein
MQDSILNAPVDGKIRSIIITGIFMQIIETIKKHLTFYEREKIEYYLKLKIGKNQIARKIKKDPSVVKREIKRNSNKSGCSCKTRFYANIRSVVSDFRYFFY